MFRTVSWITGNYSGYDTQEKIRNFIVDYYTNHGTMWVLLAGANSVIPARRGRSVVSGETGNIPADLYYSTCSGHGMTMGIMSTVKRAMIRLTSMPTSM